MRLRRRMLDSLDEDIRDHIERETQDNVDRGMAPGEARRAAVIKFGSIARIKEETRDVWISLWLEQLLQDVRYGLRMVRRNPGFTLVVVLTLAIGIGMNTAIFSVVNSVLLRPLSYPNPERLVWVAGYDEFLKRDYATFHDFVAWREQGQSYDGMAAFGPQLVTMKLAGDASQVNGVVIAGDFWQITGARPALGRLFRPDEQDVIVLTWDLFEQQFGGDPSTVGASIFLDGRQATVTGVLPKGFQFQLPRWWMNERPHAVAAYTPIPKSDLRGRNVNVVAALKPGVQIGQALAELEVMEDRIRKEFRGSPRPIFPTKLRIDPLQEKLVREARPALLVLLAAAGFVLLIACVNIANLLLVRTSTRQREIAIRAAVGAGRMRVMRQLLAESMVLAFAGAILGLAVARLAVMGLVRLSPNAVPRLPETGIDAWVLAFALGTSVSAALLFGAGPAFSLWRADLREALKDGARGSVGLAGLRMRRVLVAGELALAIVLLAGAGLMLKSYWRMNAHQDGFQPESILMMKIRLAGPQYDESSAQQAYVRELLRRLEGAPSIKAAGISTWFGFSGTPAFPADTSSEQTHTIRENAVSPGFMKAVGMRLVKGRWLTDTDPANFVLLNESMAREAFGTMNPIGGALKIPQPVTVVGVVGDLKYSKLDSRPLAEVYVRHDQLPFFRGTEVAVKTVGDPTAMANDIRKLISEIDPSQPVYDMKTLEQSLAESITPRRFNMFLMGTFAAAALLLAVVGIYGVIAYSVAERTREIGVRMALGAQRRQVIWMVIVEGIGISVAGVLIGLIAALGLTRLMSSLLYDVKPNDPLTFLVVGAVLAGTALLACWGPAIKAALMDPMMALRHE